MTMYRFLAASVVASALIPMSAGHTQERSPPPPPPSPIYDPVPGPYFVMVNAQGGMADDQQRGIIDTAWSAWRGPKLEIFAICYFHPVVPKIDWNVALRALDNVAAALKARGASVVTSSTRTCEVAQPSSPQDRPYVQIVGLIRS